MRKSVFVIAFVCLSFSLFAQTWTKEKDKDGIVIHTKSSSEYRMKASKAEMYLTASPEKVVAAILDVKNYVKWVPECAKIEVLKTTSSSDLIYYGLYETPWPAASRDLVINLKKSTISGGFKVKMINKSNYIEVRNDAVRIPIYFGDWTIVKTDKGTKVTIEYQTDPGGSVPDWMIQGAAVKTPYSMFEGLKKYLN